MVSRKNIGCFKFQVFKGLVTVLNSGGSGGISGQEVLMPRSRPDGNKFLAEVEGLLNQVMGFPNGTLALKELLELHGGVEVYVPTATEVYISWRNSQIREAFRGDNHEELSLRWKIKLRQIRNILRKTP